MIPEIIEQMRKELYDTKLCISDFEKYDLKSFKNFFNYLSGGREIWTIICL